MHGFVKHYALGCVDCIDHLNVDIYCSILLVLESLSNIRHGKTHKLPVLGLALVDEHIKHLVHVFDVGHVPNLTVRTRGKITV